MRYSHDHASGLLSTRHPSLSSRAQFLSWNNIGAACHVILKGIVCHSVTDSLMCSQFLAKSGAMHFDEYERGQRSLWGLTSQCSREPSARAELKR